MKRETRAVRYLRAEREAGLPGVWAIMSKKARREARRLVERYGYTVKAATQYAYIFGVDKRPYDFKAEKHTVPVV